MKIKDLMTSSVITCRAEDSANHAAYLMWENDCGAIPVVDDDHRPIGILTDRDVCMAAYTTGRRLGEIRVGDVMSRNVRVCRQEEPIDVAERAMQQRHVRRLPVVDAEGLLVGILSLNDLARGAVTQRDQDGDGLALEEVAKTLASVSEPWCSLEACPPSRVENADRLPVVLVPTLAH